MTSHAPQNLGMALDQLVARLRYAGWDFPKAARELERAWLLQELEAADAHVCLVARTMGIHRNTLARRMKNLDIHYGRDGRSRRRPKKDLALNWSIAALEFGVAAHNFRNRR